MTGPLYCFPRVNRVGVVHNLTLFTHPGCGTADGACAFVSLRFRAGAAARFHWVFPGVFRHFAADDLVEVDAKHVGHLDAVDHHVGKLLVHVFPVAVARFVAPLEALEQLARFYAHGFRHVGRRVELLPVAVYAELVDHAERVIGDHGCHLMRSPCYA